jgi:hypothetical protein
MNRISLEQGYPMLTGIALSRRTGDRIMITGR